MPRPGHHGAPADKAKNFSASIKNLTRALKPFYIIIIIALVLDVLGTIVAIVSPDIIADLVNEISYGLIPSATSPTHATDINMGEVGRLTVILAALYIASALFTFIQSLVMTQVSNRFAQMLRRRIITKINQLPLTYFDKYTIGDTMSRVTNDVDTVSQNLNQSFVSLFSAVTLLIGVVIMMFVTNPLMALTAMGASLVGFIFMALILSRSQKHFTARQKYLGAINGHIEETYSSLTIVKAYNGQAKMDTEFDKLNHKVYHAEQKSQFLSGLMHPLMNFIGNFGYVAVCVVGALLTMNGQIEFGTIVAFITYVRLFNSPLTQIGQATTSLQSVAAASERVFEFLRAKPLPDETNLTAHLDKSTVRGQVDFQNVQFTYVGNKKPTIHDFSAKVKPGQKVAIVGPTGAGKTTLISLLMKFYNIDSGDITIDGISINNLKRENIHDLFTMVLQDTWLFDGTVAENIAYNHKDVKRSQIEKVCRTVGLDHFIRTLPKGYNTKISDNDVSSGQRQLITIARGMIKDSPLLILDEATSNVDTRTEELVQKAMDKLTEGRTSFIIAHRLSTIKNADLILAMKDGNIVEQGTHKSLMKAGGFYAELYNSQFEL